MAKQLVVEINGSVLLGAYRKINVFLTDEDNAYLRESIVPTAAWTDDDSVAYVLDSNLGYPIIVGLLEGETTLYASYSLDSGTILGSTTITVDEDYDCNLDSTLLLEPSAQERFRIPFAKVSGIYKGRARNVVDSEPKSSHDLWLETTPAVPAAIVVSSLRLEGSQTFTRSKYVLNKQTGYGYWYGWRYGAVDTVKIF